MFHPPTRKKGCYVSKITDKKGKPVIVYINGSKILGMHKLANDNGYILQLWLPKDTFAYELMSNMDHQSKEEVIQHNSSWFHNELSQEHISEFFRPCLDQHSCSILVSSIRQPLHITWEDKTMDGFDAIFHKSPRIVSSMKVSCAIEIQGLYFYPRKYGIRWIVRSIDFKERIHMETPEFLLSAEKNDIEQFWEQEVDDVQHIIHNEIDALQKRIGALEVLTHNMNNDLSLAKKEDAMGSIWNERLETLQHRILEYNCGRL